MYVYLHENKAYQTTRYLSSNVMYQDFPLIHKSSSNTGGSEVRVFKPDLYCYDIGI